MTPSSVKNRIANHPYRYLVWNPEKREAVEVEFTPSRWPSRNEGHQGLSVRGHLLEAFLASNVLIVALVTYVFCEYGFIAGLAGAITVTGLSLIGMIAYSHAFARRVG